MKIWIAGMAYLLCSYLGAQPIITDFSPKSGPVGTEVAITGSGFDDVSGSNVVFFGATRATALATSSNTIIATVPSGASYHPITVTTAGLVAYSGAPFIVTFDTEGTLGSESFTDGGDHVTGGSPRPVALADLDGDGKVDVMAGSSRHVLSILRNTSESPGDISFAPKLDLSAHDGPSSIATADFDGDGRLDIALADNRQNRISVFRNTSHIGNIRFESKVNFAAGEHPQAVSVGDLDGDGRVDMVAVNLEDDVVSIYRNLSSGPTYVRFSARVNFQTGVGPTAISMGDLDGDGRIDLAILNDLSETVSILRNTTSQVGEISFEDKVDYEIGSYPTSITVGDLNGDNQPELAVTNSYPDNTVSVLTNTRTALGEISYEIRNDFPTGSNPLASAISDVDGDGKPDLVVTNSWEQYLSVFKNIGSPDAPIDFASKVDFGSVRHHHTGAGSLALGDLDGDDKPDAVVNRSWDYFVSIQRNTHGTPLGLPTENVRLYPNPSDDFLNIAGIEGHYEVQLFSLAGQLILVSQDHDQLDLRSLRTGIYVLRLRKPNGEIHSWKVEKN